MTKAGSILRHYRTKVLGWSQQELGAAIGLSNQYISKLEKQDYISELTRERLAPVLKCHPDDLRPDSGDLQPSEDSPPHRSENALRAAQLIGEMSEDVLSRVLPILEAVVDAVATSKRPSPARTTEFDRSKIDGRTKVGKVALAALKKRGRKSKADLEALAAVGYPDAAAKLRAVRNAPTKSKPAAKRKALPRSVHTR